MCQLIVRLHTENGEGKKFSPVDGSKIRAQTLKAFEWRYARVIISPLPYAKAKKCPPLRQGLMNLATDLNDKAKLIKSSNLNEQLRKARQAVETFLRTAKNPDGKLYFKKGEEIWPQSHSDLGKPVYGLPGVVNAVAKAISVEFYSARSHIKMLVTSPAEVYELLHQITSITKKQNTTGEEVPVVGSCKNLQCFTLNYCLKSTLIERLRGLLVDLKSANKTVVSHHSEPHSKGVNFLKMLNAICTDLSTGDEQSTEFQKALGTVNDGGFYDETNFEKVPFFYFPVNSQDLR